MGHIRFLILGLSTFFLCLPAQAMIGATDSDILKVSTIKVTLQAEAYYKQELVAGYNHCSSVVVGVKPLTLALAAHCFEQAILDKHTGLPMLSFNFPEEVINKNDLVVSHVVTDSRFESDISYDIAFIIFKNNINPSLLQPIPIRLDRESHRNVEICGYGYADYETEALKPRCSTRETVESILDISTYLSEENYLQAPTSYMLCKSSLNSKKWEFNLSNENTLAINRLNDSGQYSIEVPMVKVKDSGGPWFFIDEKGQRQVVALTSMINTFPHLSRKWGFTRSSNRRKIHRHDLPFAGFAVKLSTNAALEMIDKAKALGADIQTIENKD